MARAWGLWIAGVSAIDKVPLPDLIEIVPLDKPVRAEITVPGSKSITNRALILAALADGEATLQGALWSEDTQVMVQALQKLGFELNVEPDHAEFCNRTITVKGLGGKIPNTGTAEKPLEIFVGNAGTAARFLATLVCLGQGAYRLHGVPRMHDRPQAALFGALRELGYRIDSPNDRLPAVIHGAGPRAGRCRVSIEESSQFASGLLLCANRGAWSVEVTGNNAEESPYIAMTSKLIEVFPKASGTFQTEPDASSGSYFLAAGLFVPQPEYQHSERPGLAESIQSASGVSVARWPTTDWQVDRRFMGVLPRRVSRDSRVTFGNQVISRRRDLGDSIMTAIVLAPFSIEPIRFTELGRLRVQECERVTALRTELHKCGAKVIESDNTLEVFPSELHGAEIETYNDHRMAMCFAILGLKVPGIKIKNPSCVKKTFPNFFQKLAAAPPHGLGATILDAKTSRQLLLEELFADETKS
jgi:3-phosphoshikimate 1-carboxyvinyltransferase